jgi:hypothetical protein
MMYGYKFRMLNNNWGQCNFSERMKSVVGGICMNGETSFRGTSIENSAQVKSTLDSGGAGRQGKRE